MAFIITTTGTQNPVVFSDLGDFRLPHPTTDYDLENDFQEEEIRASVDVQDAIDNGHITVEDGFGNSITKTRQAIAHYEIAGLTRDDHLQYVKTIGSVRPVLNLDTVEDGQALVFSESAQEFVAQDVEGSVEDIIAWALIFAN